MLLAKIQWRHLRERGTEHEDYQPGQAFHLNRSLLVEPTDANIIPANVMAGQAAFLCRNGAASA